jgi:hypothetical protein
MKKHRAEKQVGIITKIPTKFYALNRRDLPYFELRNYKFEGVHKISKSGLQRDV